MDIAALALAAVALLIALSARKTASRLDDELRATRREMLTRAADDDDVGGDMNVLRRHVELLAKGATIDPLSVREKRLYSNVNTTVLQKRVESGEALAIIDVRTDNEWSGGHIKGARHIPSEDVEKRLGEVPRDGTPLYAICAGGGRSATAAEFLAKRGFLNVHNVEGGMNSWRGEVSQD